MLKHLNKNIFKKKRFTRNTTRQGTVNFETSFTASSENKIRQF